VGILGGTFDPPHNGHIAIARAALKELRLSKIIFIPALIQPHKAAKTATPAENRINMLRLALTGENKFEISDIELRRKGPSFTVDTLEDLRGSYPADQFFLIIGADNVSEIESWQEPERIFELAAVCAANRPKYEASGRFAREIKYFRMPLVDISSTEIRARIRTGQSVSGMIAPEVERYITDKGLYLNDA